MFEHQKLVRIGGHCVRFEFLASTTTQADQTALGAGITENIGRLGACYKQRTLVLLLTYPHE